MNILYIAHERNMGGASRCLLDLACGMKARGHNVYVIVPIRGCRVQRELEQRGITVIPIFFLWWEYPSYWKWYLKVPFRMIYSAEGFAVARVVHVIRSCHINVVHSNSSVIDIGMRAARKCGVRHIWHFREFGDLDYQLEFFRGREHSLQQLNQSRSCVIYISERVKRHYESYIDSALAQVIYDGIDQSYCIKRNTEVRDKVIFLVSGYLHRNKRQDLILKAAHILSKRSISDYEIWIAGKPSAMEDSRKFATELHALAENLGEHVRFLGYVDHMIELRKKTDVEVVPSAEEAFGRVTVEAMMAQMPVIGSDSGANPEIIEEGITGMLFQSGNEEQLADRMQEMISHKNEIRRMGIAAQERACRYFSLEKNLDEIGKVYQNDRKTYGKN